MTWNYQIYVELFDVDDDRFWYSTLQLEESEPLSRRSIRREVERALSDKISLPGYESLRQWLDEDPWTWTSEIVAVWQT